MRHEVNVFDDFHLHGASAPEWHQHYVQVSRGEMHSSLAEVTTGGVHVFRKWMSERVVQEGCLPARKICFAVLRGEVADTPRMQGREFAMDSLFVLRGDESFSLHRPKGMELLAITFEVEEFLRLSDERSLSPAGRSLLSRSPLKAPLPLMQALRRDLLDAFFDPAATTIDPRGVFHSICDVLESAASTRASVASASASSLVARCHRIVACSAAEPPSIEALCTRLRTSRRSLQSSFRQVADTTPVHYIRSLRLDGIRRELLSTRSATSVTQAAMAHGFTHLGRFTQEYKALFGELPSTTLRERARSR